MRRRDKLKNYEQANIMLEQSYLKSKGLLIEYGRDNCSSTCREVQTFVDNNQYLKGTKVTDEDLITTPNYILFVSDESLKHIKERHSDPKKPGSIINPSVNLREVIKRVMLNSPTEDSGGRVKWLDVDSGVDVGFMGVKKGDPEEVIKMTDYTMPDGKKEVVKITKGDRIPTKIFNVITGELGVVEEHGGVITHETHSRKVLSLITAFPGGMSVDGTQIPLDRSDMAKLGLYFVVE